MILLWSSVIWSEAVTLIQYTAAFPHEKPDFSPNYTGQVESSTRCGARMILFPGWKPGDSPRTDQNQQQICKFECKAGLSTTSMKSHINLSGESLCTGGNKNEAQPAGNTTSYFVPLPTFPPLSLPRPSLLHFLSFLSLMTHPTQFILAIFITFIPVFWSFDVTVPLLLSPYFPHFLLGILLSEGFTSGSFQTGLLGWERGRELERER